MKYISPFSRISKKDSMVYGGKVASLGEMYSAGIPVPNGFGVSIEAHRELGASPLQMSLGRTSRARLTSWA
jgi:phosphoenolpyruvate synthase/pyruvate phosphate dikinase